MRQELKDNGEESEREGFEDTHMVRFEQAIVLWLLQNKLATEEKKICGFGLFLCFLFSLIFMMVMVMYSWYGVERNERWRECLDEVLG